MLNYKALESPIDYTYRNLLNEEDIFIFHQNFEQMKIQEELNLDDNIYF